MRFDLSEITDLIRDRRTIYPEQFTSRTVQKDMVENILTNGLWAPTHGKTQPWRFKVYYEDGRQKLREQIEEIHSRINSEDAFPTRKLEKLLKRFEKTSVIVALIMQRTPETRIPEIEEIEAVACAAQNIMLTSTAYGLGAFWSSPGFIYTPEANEVFDLKEDDKLLGLIYLGYPEVEWPKSHRKPLEYVTEWVNEK